MVLRLCFCVLPSGFFCGTCSQRRELVSKFDLCNRQRLLPLSQCDQTGHHSAGVPRNLASIDYFRSVDRRHKTKIIAFTAANLSETPIRSQALASEDRETDIFLHLVIRFGVVLTGFTYSSSILFKLVLSSALSAESE